MGGGKLRELIMSRLHPAKRGGGTVPRGHFAVYVGDSRTRFVVPTAYLRHPAFLALLETAEEEFGYGGGGITIPCSEQDFAALVGRLGSSSPSSSSSSSWH
ncbi:auxin-induced protein 15A [Brachypodium distachyon]|uniref:Uncharacterized protein n=1 Tax=Brachypodium distachyon TaxID=15368 RepID=A0A0Q3F635_BRADI|nr:auxin-induced protein 15A [Brachypodium distachyon]KQJ94894.1 hypothetical protein BRADI_3g13904v3 [Brachypodium distachyon]|eukprot:XP_003571332.1 auxin-induced protein 15A [Brachypodium distachyon]